MAAEGCRPGWAQGLIEAGSLWQYTLAPVNEDVPGPVTALQVRAAELHEMFLAWQLAGFSEYQALELTKAAIMAMILK